MTTHHLGPTTDTTADVFDRDHVPVLSVDPGDRVVVETLDANGYLAPQTVPGEDQPRMFTTTRGHCLTGPIAIRGAEPGDWLALHLERFEPGSWGWTNAAAVATRIPTRLGLTPEDKVQLLWSIADGTASTRIGETTFRRPTAPFLGVIGTAPAEPGEHSTIPPRPGSGGNLDCKELVAGATLFIPVAVPGALLYLGDGHAAQGDGEVSGTAIECPMTTTLTVDLVRDPALSTPYAETPAGRIAFGLSEDLNEAAGAALDALVTWMRQLYGVDKATALALASVAVDLRVTQVANYTWGVHAVLPPEALEAQGARPAIQSRASR